MIATRAPDDAFVAWFETLAHYIRLKHGLGEALHNAAIQDAINETYARSSPRSPSSWTPASPPAPCEPASTPPTSC
ncbi:hypothetical protein GCM10009608_31740 [Pseudonocardia alaniniphila]